VDTLCEAFDPEGALLKVAKDRMNGAAAGKDGARFFSKDRQQASQNRTGGKRLLEVSHQCCWGKRAVELDGRGPAPHPRLQLSRMLKCEYNAQGGQLRGCRAGGASNSADACNRHACNRVAHNWVQIAQR
jgi:hypothetical protein